MRGYKTSSTCGKMPNMNLAAFMGEFKAEAYEHLEKLDQGLLQLEREPSNQQLIRQLFLSIHTIKGGASMLELKVLKNLTHAFEDVLARLRDQSETCDSHTITLMLRALDLVREIIDTNPNMDVMPANIEEMTSKLRQRASGVIIILENSSSSSAIQMPPTLASIESKIALLLEPSATARHVMTTHLETAGWTVQSYSTTEELITVVQLAGLLVIPLEPNGINGLQIAEDWRGSGIQTPVLLTALEFSPEQKIAANTLRVQCVPKPSWQETHLTETARGFM